MKDPFSTGSDDDTKGKSVAVAQENKQGITVTLKGGTGYDAPWVVIHADTPEQALDLLHDDETFKNLLDQSAKVGKYFAEKGAPVKAASGGGDAKPARQNAPGGESRQCSHGEMTFRSGVSGSGKAWKGFFCPTPKGTAGQCEPEFIR